MAETNIGATIAIAVDSTGSVPDPQNSDLDASGFGALDYADIPRVGQLGETGVDQGINQYETWGELLTAKQKGSASGMDSDLRCLNVTSNGLTALKAAAQIDDQNNYVLRVTYSSGDIEYLRGLIVGPRLSKGNNNAFREFICTVALNQAPVEV